MQSGQHRIRCEHCHKDVTVWKRSGARTVLCPNCGKPIDLEHESEIEIEEGTASLRDQPQQSVASTPSFPEAVPHEPVSEPSISPDFKDTQAARLDAESVPKEKISSSASTETEPIWGPLESHSSTASGSSAGEWQEEEITEQPLGRWMLIFNLILVFAVLIVAFALYRSGRKWATHTPASAQKLEKQMESHTELSQLLQYSDQQLQEAEKTAASFLLAVAQGQRQQAETVGQLSFRSEEWTKLHAALAPWNLSTTNPPVAVGIPKPLSQGLRFRFLPRSQPADRPLIVDLLLFTNQWKIQAVTVPPPPHQTGTVYRLEWIPRTSPPEPPVSSQSTSSPPAEASGTLKTNISSQSSPRSRPGQSSSSTDEKNSSSGKDRV